MTNKKISRDEFVEFLNLLKLKGFIENKEILLESTPTNLTAHARSIDKSFGLKGVFYGEFDQQEEVGITNLAAFIKYIELVKKDFEIKYQKNKIIISGIKDKISTVMQNKNYIINKLEPVKFKKVLDSFDKGISFKITKEVSADIVKKHSAIFVNSDKTEEIILRGKPNTLTLKLSNSIEETDLISEYDMPDIKDSFEINISKKFIDLLSCLKFDVKINLVLPSPRALSVSAETEAYRLDYLFALNTED